MLLLDTCTLLWLASDQKKLSHAAKKAIVQRPGSLFVSSISAFEIAIKSRSGKIVLPLPPVDWYNEALDFHCIHEIPVSGVIAAASVELPLLHNDPCDRIIIATAQLNSMKIVTGDSVIREYAQTVVIW